MLRISRITWGEDLFLFQALYDFGDSYDHLFNFTRLRNLLVEECLEGDSASMSSLGSVKNGLTWNTGETLSLLKQSLSMAPNLFPGTPLDCFGDGMKA